MPPSTEEIRDWFGPMPCPTRAAPLRGRTIEEWVHARVTASEARPCPIALPILTLADVRGMLVEFRGAAQTAAQTFGDLIVALDAESVGGAGE